jgi:hypothetical protein
LRQFSCDCRNAHEDDDELERQGKAGIWFELVDSRKQYGGNDADAEDVNDSQHSDIPFRGVATTADRFVATQCLLRRPLIFDNSPFHARLAVTNEGKPAAILSSILLNEFDLSHKFAIAC